MRSNHNHNHNHNHNTKLDPHPKPNPNPNRDRNPNSNCVLCTLNELTNALLLCSPISGCCLPSSGTQPSSLLGGPASPVPDTPPNYGPSLPPSWEAQLLSLSLCFSRPCSPADLAASSWSIIHNLLTLTLLASAADEAVASSPNPRLSPSPN